MNVFLNERSDIIFHIYHKFRKRIEIEFQREIQICIYFQYAVIIMKFVVAYNSSLDCFVKKSKHVANLHANLC
jgi:hypothetical protein